MGNELVVAFDREERLASLSYHGDFRAWPPIRRACLDDSEYAQLVGSSALRMPWWVFLGCRPKLSYLMRRHSFTIRYDTSAQSRIDQADRSSHQYQFAIDRAIASDSEITDALAAKGFKRELTAEQLRNVRVLSRLPAGATFSVPGAGKTTEALAVYCLRRKPNSRLIVICPKNAFSAWEEQLEVCLSNEIPFQRLRGGVSAIQRVLAESPSKVLVTYQQLPNITNLMGIFIEEAQSFVFLDESHRIKRGFSGVIGNSILSLAEIPEFKLIMSGTPMPNDISDLVPQFRFLYPEISADETSVEKYIKPIYVRTTKKELNLPEKRETIIRIPLRPAQFELYELLRSEASRQGSARALQARDRMLLRRLGQSALRMLQVVTNPALLARIPFEYPDLLSDVLLEGDSPKLEYACQRARQLAQAGKKSIIWSSFVDNVELVANRLIDLGSQYIHGGVDAGDEDEEGTREQRVKRFHEDPRAFVLVANPAACGEGISLHTVCHHAIYLDRNYNAAQYLQSEDRIHRLGLAPEEITFIEVLQAPNTIDESVNRRLSTKIANMARVLSDPSLIVEPETVDLDADGFDLEDLADFLKHTAEIQVP